MSACVAALSQHVCEVLLELAWHARGMPASNPPKKVLLRHSLGGGAYMAAVLAAIQVCPEMIDLPSLADPVC